MKRRNIGDRVGAILSADEHEVHLLGFGVYDGEHEPPFGPLGTTLEEHHKTMAEMKAAGTLAEDFVWTNPRITLDDGRVVWGAQCWWGSEEAIRKTIEGRRIVPA
jgi:hypothetical protein